MGYQIQVTLRLEEIAFLGKFTLAVENSARYYPSLSAMLALCQFVADRKFLVFAGMTTCC